MTITSYSPSLGVKRTYILEASDTVKGALYTQTFYQTENQALCADMFVDSLFELYDPGEIVWSFNGGGSGVLRFLGTVCRAVPPFLSFSSFFFINAGW